MLKKLLHRIWNERRENAWLFVELLVVSLVVWLATDPLFNLISRDNVPKRYDSSNVYNLAFMSYRDNSYKYKEELNVPEVIMDDYRQMLKRIEALPDVESYYIGLGDAPGLTTKRVNTSYAIRTEETEGVENRTVMVPLCISMETEKSDIFKVLRIKDSATGETYTKKDIGNGTGAYITRSLAAELFGSANAIGKTVVNDSRGGERYTVMGVLDDIQDAKYCEPGKLMILSRTLPTDGIHNAFFLESFIISIRVKDGVDNDAFEKKFRKEVLPQLTFGNCYCFRFQSYRQEMFRVENYHGIVNSIRQNIILSSFALLCAMLGIIGTFWVRAVARRQEVGIMQSMGATRGDIVRQFATEAAMLATLAFAIALPLLLHKVHVSGFAEPAASFIDTPISATAAWRNKPVPHFIIVTAISYLFILAISVVGAIVPTISNIRRPADALRDE